MANAVKDNTSYAVEIESTEGIYVAPTSANSFVQVLKDGAELTKSQELLQREIFTGSIGKVSSRLGTRSVSGALPVEMRANSVEGDNPEFDALITSALGAKKERASVTTKTGNTATVLQIEDADIGGFSVYDIIKVEEAGAHEMSWISAVDPTGGAANITLGHALQGAPSDNVEISATTQYQTANSGHPSLSISKYIETTKDEIAVGCKVTSMSLENASTGQIASMNFGFEGLTFDSRLTARPFTPDYDDAKPPIMLRACLYQNDNQTAVNDIAFSMENTLGFVTSTCSENGRISSRVTARAITGTFNPYKQDDDLTQFDFFKCNDPYSLFVYAFNPMLDANCDFTGEFEESWAVLFPNCITTELGESDADGLLVEDISFEANRGDDGTIEEMTIAFV